MDAQQALADLTEISSQIRAAVVFDETGKIAAATLGDEGRAGELAEAAGRLLEHAEGIRVMGGARLTQLEAATLEGSVFVVSDGKTRIAATTGPAPTVGLVFYDLKSVLRSIAPAPKRPVRASGPGERASGEPGGSPASTRRPKKKPAAKRAVRAPGPGEEAPKAPESSAGSTKKPPAPRRRKKPDAS